MPSNSPLVPVPVLPESFLLRSRPLRPPCVYPDSTSGTEQPDRHLPQGWRIRRSRRRGRGGCACCATCCTIARDRGLTSAFVAGAFGALGLCAHSSEVLHSHALVVSLGRHAAASPALAAGGSCRRWPLRCHAAAEFKRLVQSLDHARGRVRSIVEIDAVFAGKAGERDPEPAQFGDGQLEGGRGRDRQSSYPACARLERPSTDSQPGVG